MYVFLWHFWMYVCMYLLASTNCWLQLRPPGMKSLWELVNNLGCGHHRDCHMRISGLWGYKAHALFSPPIPGDFHTCQSCSITGLLCTLSWARLSSLLSPLLLLGYLLSSSGWALGFLCTRSALCMAQPHPLPCGLRLCLFTHHLHCAAPSLAGFLVPHTIPLPCNPVAAQHPRQSLALQYTPWRCLKTNAMNQSINK